MRRSLLAAAGLGSVVIALSGCGVVGGSTANAANPGSAYGANAKSTAKAVAAPMQTGTILKIEKTKLGGVLADSKGLTLYYYTKDDRGVKSVCTGKCLAVWPAVTGKPVAASGLKLAFPLGSITRPGGIIQATYNGFPLYTYASDMAPGQVTGNGVGGVWHVITGKVLTSMTSSGSGSMSGSGSGASPAASPSASATSGGSSSGYGGGY